MVKLINREKGFTLIEVVLVLAIAALIMLIVFLAVGGAQRTRRDAARKENAGRVLSAMESYASNNNGAYAIATLAPGYLVNITDPTGNGAAAVAGPPALAAGGPEYGAGPATAAHPMWYASNKVCKQPVDGTMVAGGARNAAVSYWSEVASSATCVDNN